MELLTTIRTVLTFLFADPERLNDGRLFKLHVDEVLVTSPSECEDILNTRLNGLSANYKL